MRFILKTLFIYSLTVVLIDGNTPFIGKFLAQSAFAEEVTSDLETLSNAYNGLFNAVDPATENMDYAKIQQNLLSETGENALAQGQAFIKDPNNRAALGTPKGQNFLNMHNKFTRLRKIKKSLDNCFGENSGKSHLDKGELHGGLPTRIFAAALSRPAGEVACDPAIFDSESLEALYGGVSPIIRARENAARVADLNKLQQAIQHKNMEAAARTLAGLKVTYAGADPSAVKANPPINDSSAMGIVNKVCPAPYSTTKRRTTTNHPGCSSEQRNKLKAAVLDEQRKMLANPALKTYSHETAAVELKERVRDVNDVINRSPFDMTDNTLFPDNIDPRTPKSQESYSNYINSFMKMASDGPGLLVWTDAIGEDMGMRRDQDSRFMGIWGGGFDTRTQKLKPHSEAHITEDKVRAAIAEAERKTLEKAKDTFEIEHNRTNFWDTNKGRATEMSLLGAGDYTTNEFVEQRRTDIKKLIKENPTSIGQALMDNPDMVDETCLMVQEIAQDAEDDGKWYSASNLMWGALIVGGVLLGGAALAGLAMLAFAGTAAAGGALLSALTVPGLVFGAAESTYAITRARSAAAEREALRASLITGTADEQTASEFYQAMEEAQDAWTEAQLALGFTVLDAAAFLRIARQMGSAAEATAYFRRLKSAARVMATRDMRRIFRHVRPLVGKAKVQRMLNELFKLDDGVDFLNKIKNLDLDEAADLFRNGYVVCNRFCG